MKKGTKLLSLFLTVAILITSMVLVLPVTAEEAGTENDAAETLPETETEQTVVAEGFWSQYTAESFAGGVRYGQTGYGTAAKPYEISTAEEFAYFAWLVNRGPGYSMSEKYFRLSANIDLSAHYWEPIAKTYTSSKAYDFDDDGTKDTRQVAFSGVFDGGGYTISGLKFTDDYYGADGKLPATYGGLALFGTLRGASPVLPAIVRNVNIVGSANLTGYQATTSNFSAPVTMVAYAVYQNAQIQNVNVTTDIYVSGPSGEINVAGIVGYLTNGGVIENCTVSGEIVVDNSTTAVTACAGGLVARSGNGGSIINCVNNANVTVKTKTNYAMAGGIVAKTQADNSANADAETLEMGMANLTGISGCVNNGNITAINETGGSGTLVSAVGACIGFAGRSSNKGDALLLNCINTGVIKATNVGTGAVSAMIGIQRCDKTQITNCYSLTEPVCENAAEAEGIEPAFICNAGAERATNGTMYFRRTYLTPKGSIFLPTDVVETTAGAALRINPSKAAVASLRFESKIGEDFLALMEGKTLNYGTIVLDVETAKAAAEGVATVTDMMNKLSSSDYRTLSPIDPTLGEDGVFTSIITNIKEIDYETTYVAVGYVSLVLDSVSGYEVILYANFDPSEIESRAVTVKSIAEVYYNLRQDTQDEDYANEVGEDYDPSLGKYSLFTDEQLAIFKLYMSEESDENDTPVVTPDNPDDSDDSDELGDGDMGLFGDDAQ